MGKLDAYLGQRLRQGASQEQIAEDLVKAGYPKAAAKGAFLTHSKRTRLLQWSGVAALSSVVLAALLVGGSGVAGMLTYEYARSYSDPLEARAVEPSEIS